MTDGYNGGITAHAFRQGERGKFISDFSWFLFFISFLGVCLSPSTSGRLLLYDTTICICLFLSDFFFSLELGRALHHPVAPVW